jgi:hypothetical protein
MKNIRKYQQSVDRDGIGRNSQEKGREEKFRIV